MPQRIDFHDWTFLPETGELSNSEFQHHLPPRLVRLLVTLCSTPGEVWRRDDLLQKVWGERVVNEEVLSRAISQLRQKLGDDPAAPQFIATVPKVGYRWLAGIQTQATASEVPPHSEYVKEPSSPAGSDRPRKIALLFGATILIAAVIAVALFLLKPEFSDSAIPVTSTPNTDLLFNAQRMTAQPGVERFVEISPDGQYLAYVAVVDQRYAVHLVNVGDSDQIRLIESDYSQLSPVFSPSGSHLAVAEFDANGCHVIVLEVNGQERRNLGECQYQGAIPLLDWSNDGQWLAVSAPAQEVESAAIWLVNLMDGSRRQLSQPSDAYHADARPRFSPDQNHISFSRGTPAYRELYLLAIDASHDARALTDDHQYTVSHDWLSDGSGIIFDSDRSGERGLWFLDVPLQGEPITAPKALGARGSQYPSVARQINRMAFQVAEYEANIWRYSQTSSAEPQRLVASTKYDSNPALSPDGEWLSFVSNRSGRGSIWVSRADGSEIRKVYEPEEGRAAWPVWSANGEKIYFVHYQQGGQWLSELSLTSLTARHLDLPHQGFGMALSTDQQYWTYTALLDKQGTQVWRVPVDFSVAPEPIGPIGSKRGLLDANGVLYFCRDDDANIYRWQQSTQSENSGPAESLVLELDGLGWQSWFIWQQQIYYSRSAGERSGIWRYDLNSGQNELLLDLVPSALGPNMTIDPHSQDLIVSMTDRAEADLFISNLPF